MNYAKKIALMICFTLVICSTHVKTAYAVVTLKSYNTNTGLDFMILRQYLIDVSTHIINGDINKLKSVIASRNLFTSLEYNNILVSCGNMTKLNGNPIEVEAVYTEKQFSSTEDTVAFVDLKVEYTGYNKIYLIEYHINKDGKIYGHNIWVY